MIEDRLEQVDLRLEEIALRLRDQERRRESGVEAAVLDGQALLREVLAGSGGVDALSRALHVSGGASNGLGDLQLETRDAVRRLLALDLGACETGLFEAPAERIVDGDADAPRREVAAEDLAEHVAESSTHAAGHGSRKWSGAHQLRPADTAAPI